ncbi:hypothetical protein C162_26725 [Paenibacillus sp. FSL R7-269]|uniref:hypothetical protein n=1 Tax=Paenibacillus sp. FSL R7-269 TaxID=1226755 RepID=UPI0003E240A7|nr:hypothetical protein [Paenibacillus sp. FSL R7-269]ETT40921.1 hypothetical protein C162_26725 [Paenibacillus sp. FSL R7-269]
MAEIKRDLKADLAFCSKDSVIGVYVHEATKAWPHAIARAIAAERRIRELCESNAYYIKQAERAEDDSYYTREELESTRKELAQLRAGIAVAMTYSGGIIVEMLRKLLTEVPADE